MTHILEDQDGVITRAQALTAGMTGNDVRRLLRREWRTVYPGVYINHNGPLTWTQQAWAAVLVCGRDAALAGESALRAHAGPGGPWREHPVEVVIPHERKAIERDGLALARSVTHRAEVLPLLHPPRQRVECAAITAAEAAPTDVEALGVLAKAMQSRRTTARHMAQALASRTRSSRRVWLESVLADLIDGACSVLEFGYVRNIERAHGLPRAQRQARANSTMGLTYRDNYLKGLVIELDGRLFHNTAAQRDRDFDRDLDAAADGAEALRLSYGQVYVRECATSARLARVFARRGWPGTPHSCGPGCPIPG